MKNGLKLANAVKVDRALLAVLLACGLRRHEVVALTLDHLQQREEALEWTKRFPNPVGEGAEAEIEVRQLYELDDLGPSDAIERFRELVARRK